MKSGNMNVKRLILIALSFSVFGSGLFINYYLNFSETTRDKNRRYKFLSYLSPSYWWKDKNLYENNAEKLSSDSGTSSDFSSDSSSSSISLDREFLPRAKARNGSEKLPGCFYVYNCRENTWEEKCSRIMKHGFPGTENIYFKDGFVLSYSYKFKQPLWVMEKIHKKTFHSYDHDQTRTQCNFQPDPEIPEMFSAANSDYRNSGFDRGHMAAFANHNHNPDLKCVTFLLSNVSPQVGKGFNRNIWKQVEGHVRDLRKKKYDSLYSCTGILFLPTYDKRSDKFKVTYETIGDNHVAVPTHFFKVILGHNKNSVFEVESFIIPNAHVPDHASLDKFRVSLESVEKASGLIFFNKIPREKIIEVHNTVSTPRDPALT